MIYYFAFLPAQETTHELFVKGIKRVQKILAVCPYIKMSVGVF